MSSVALIPQCSKRFSAYDADVVFQSSDGFQFRLHKKYLENCSGGFPPCEFDAPADEIISLDEDSDTLGLLFQFVYPQRYPCLMDVKFDMMEKVAEAAEKYEIFPAMNHCEMCMRQNITAHADEVLVYAAKHDYPMVLDVVWTHALKVPLGRMATILPPHLLVSWIKWYQLWVVIKDSVIQRGETHYDSYGVSSCGYWAKECRSPVIERLAMDISFLIDADTLFVVAKAKDRGCCKVHVKKWCHDTKVEVEKVPYFRNFLKSSH